MTAIEISRIRPGTSEYESLRKNVTAGNVAAAKDFVYVCAHLNLLRMKAFSPRQRIKTLSDLMKADLIEVAVNV